MTSKEAYEKMTLDALDPDNGYSPEFAMFDAGWKAALDEAVKACEQLYIVDPVFGNMHSQRGDARATRDDCIFAIEDLK